MSLQLRDEDDVTRRPPSGHTLTEEALNQTRFVLLITPSNDQRCTAMRIRFSGVPSITASARVKTSIFFTHRYCHAISQEHGRPRTTVRLYWRLRKDVQDTRSNNRRARAPTAKKIATYRAVILRSRLSTTVTPRTALHRFSTDDTAWVQRYHSTTREVAYEVLNWC